MPGIGSLREFLLSLPLGVLMVTLLLIVGIYVGWVLGRAFERQRQEEHFANLPDFEGYPRKIRRWND